MLDPDFRAQDGITVQSAGLADGVRTADSVDCASREIF